MCVETLSFHYTGGFVYKTMEEKKAQLEDGYSKLANSLVEKLARTILSVNEAKVVFCIIRKTYGFHKKNDCMPLSQIALMTELQKSNISRTLKSLIFRKIVIVSDNAIGMNTCTKEWVKKLSRTITAKPPRVLSSAIKSVIVSDNKSLSSATPQYIKDTYSKDKVPKGTVARRAKLTPEERKKKAEIHRAENDIMLEFLKKKIRVDDFTELNEEKRRWVYLIVALFKKLGKETCRDRLDSILSDSFLAKNCNSLKFVYKQLKGFRESESLMKTNIIS